MSRFSGEIGFSSLTLLPPSLTPPFMKRPVGSWFDHLTPTERLAELGQILAAGLMRLQARQSSQLSDDCGDSSVDFLPDRSGHADTLTRRTA